MDVFVWGYGELGSWFDNFCKKNKLELGDVTKAQEVATETGWIGTAPQSFARWLKFPEWDDEIRDTFDIWFHDQDALEGCILGSDL